MWDKLKSRKDLFMTKRNINSKKGFTIIEVVLVLAIAGLIFLMVFVALPALQRSQRDTQRRDDMARFSSQLSQYQANNNGKVPTASTSGYTDFIKNYLTVNGTDSFADPSTGNTYEIPKVVNCNTYKSQPQCNPNRDSNTDTTLGHIYVYYNATCEGERPKYVQGDRKIAFTLKLEGGGIYCGHN